MITVDGGDRRVDRLVVAQEHLHGLDQLLAELGKLQDPRRALRLIGIGIGPSVDPTELFEATCKPPTSGG